MLGGAVAGTGWSGRTGTERPPSPAWAREREGVGFAARAAAAGASNRGSASEGGRSIDWSYAQESSDEAPAIRPGTRVRHAMFGPGVVRWVEGTGESTKLTVNFERAGIRKLLLRVAPIEIVGS